MNNKLYAVRDKETGKLVSDLTSPSRTYWKQKGAALAAWARPFYRNYKANQLELVCFELVEVKDEE